MNTPPLSPLSPETRNRRRLSRRANARAAILAGGLGFATLGAGAWVITRQGGPAAARGASGSPPLPALVSVKGNQTALSPDRVLVVCNAQIPDSRAITAYYTGRRKIPAQNVIRIVCPETDEWKWAEYKTALEDAVKRRALADPKIDYVVLTRGIPFRLSDRQQDGGYGTDGVLATCLMTPRPVAKTVNPYYYANERFARAKFKNMLLVTRLDGPTREDAIKLVDSSLAAKPFIGPFYLRDSFVLPMKPAVDILRARGFSVTYLEGINNKKYPLYQGPGGPYMAHWGAGQHDDQYSEAEYKQITFLPGALGDITWSMSAYNLRIEGSAGNIATMTARGAAGAHGYVSEPFSDTISKPEVVLDRYTHGFSLAESFGMGSSYIYWKDLVLGDPLCAPYAAK